MEILTSVPYQAITLQFFKNGVGGQHLSSKRENTVCILQEVAEKAVYYDELSLGHNLSYLLYTSLID
jgi:hypothetical protein